MLSYQLSFNLPSDVFDIGEKKPQKKGAKGASKKRGPSEVTIVATVAKTVALG